MSFDGDRSTLILYVDEAGRDQISMLDFQIGTWRINREILEIKESGGTITALLPYTYPRGAYLFSASHPVRYFQ